VRVKVAGRGGVAADATAALLNLTTVSPAGAGFATVYPCTAEPPTASNVNYSAGSFVANGVVAKLDAEGYVCVFTLASSHLILDVGGFVGTGADLLPVAPARLLDTRPDESVAAGEHPARGAVGPAGSVRVKVAGRGGVAPGASVAVMNVTAVTPEGPGYVTVYPCTANVPNASNVNYGPGTVVANNVVAQLDAEGYVCLYTLARAHLLVDVSGYL
jgi:hypothetical protein